MIFWNTNFNNYFDTVSGAPIIDLILQENVTGIPVVFYDTLPDYKDRTEYIKSKYQSNVVRYFKRDLVIGQKFAVPCPDSVPASKATPPWERNRSGVGYDLLGVQGDWTETVVDGLQDVKNNNAPLIGAHWATHGPGQFHQYDQEKFWRLISQGCAVVAQRPFIQIPFPFITAEHLRFVEQPDEIVTNVEELLTRESRAMWLAEQSFEWFLEHHMSEKRARWVLEQCGYVNC